MRIAVSFLNFRPGHVGGVETCLRQLLACLPAAGGDDEIVAVGHEGNAAVLDVPGIERAIVPRGDRGIVMARCAEAFTPYRARFAERVLAGIGAEVVYFPQQSVFPKRVDVPCVVQVHDVQHVLLPGHFSFFDRAFRRAIYPYSMRRADRIVAISEWTKRTLVDRCEVAAEKIDVIRHGCSGVRREDVAPFDEVGGPYLYYPAATYPHKGHARLLRTFAALRKREGFGYKLVLTGERTGYWGELERLIRGLGLEGEVVHLGYVPYEQVLRVYAGAGAVVFPTEYEGFGLPVLEAAGLGKRVIVSRLEVFDEIGVPRQFQIDFAEPWELLRALEAPGAIGLEREPWTWRAAAEATLRVLRRTGREGRENRWARG